MNNADAVVTGKMSLYWLVPWFGGPYLWGRLATESVLKGAITPKSTIWFYWRCNECSNWFSMPSHWDPGSQQVWYLQQVSPSVWSPCYCFPLLPKMSQEKIVSKIKSYLAQQHQLTHKVK